MASYKLTIRFAREADLHTIRLAKQRVTLIKQTDPGDQLAWIAFDPFMHNTVEWTDDYASEDWLSLGVRVVRQHVQKAR